VLSFKNQTSKVNRNISKYGKIIFNRSWSFLTKWGTEWDAHLTEANGFELLRVMKKQPSDVVYIQTKTNGVYNPVMESIRKDLSIRK
jgi:hypothetical protein